MHTTYFDGDKDWKYICFGSSIGVLKLHGFVPSRCRYNWVDQHRAHVNGDVYRDRGMRGQDQHTTISKISLASIVLHRDGWVTGRFGIGDHQIIDVHAQRTIVFNDHIPYSNQRVTGTAAGLTVFNVAVVDFPDQQPTVVVQVSVDLGGRSRRPPTLSIAVTPTAVCVAFTTLAITSITNANVNRRVTRQSVSMPVESIGIVWAQTWERIGGWEASVSFADVGEFR